MPLPYPTIYRRVKDLLSEINGVDRAIIKAHMELKSPPFRFDNRGLRALAPKLNKEFIDQKLDVIRDETEALDTVRSVARLVNKKIN